MRALSGLFLWARFTCAIGVWQVNYSVLFLISWFVPMLGDHETNMDWLPSSSSSELGRQEEDKSHRWLRSRLLCFALMLLTSVGSLKKFFFSMILQKTKLLWNIRKMCVENRCRAIRMKIGFCCRWGFLLMLNCVRWKNVFGSFDTFGLIKSILIEVGGDWIENIIEVV